MAEPNKMLEETANYLLNHCFLLGGVEDQRAKYLYVQDHLSEQITVSEMAQAAGYHVSHFTQLFQKQMGISPGQFIQKKKSDTAAQLLTSTDLPVAEIADSLGFSNPFYFSSFFKKQTGMTPSAYRTIYLRTYLQ